MKDQKHWDVDEDYIVDVTNSITIFQRIQATDAELALVSAAPELLEALQKMIGCIEYYASLKESDQPNIEDWAYANNSAEVEMSRAAIAKALGK